MTDEISRKLDTMVDALSPLNGLTDLALRMETLVAEIEKRLSDGPADQYVST